MEIEIISPCGRELERAYYNQGFTGIEPQRHRAHKGRTTETTIIQREICNSFQVLVISKIARLCELCASVVNNSN
jgi:hypothetical protein